MTKSIPKKTFQDLKQAYANAVRAEYDYPGEYHYYQHALARTVAEYLISRTEEIAERKKNDNKNS